MRTKKFSALKAVCLILCLHFGFWVLIGFLLGASTHSVSSILRDEIMDALLILFIVAFIKKTYLITFAEIALNYPKPGSKLWFGLLLGGLLWVGAGIVSDAIEKVLPTSLLVPMKYDFLAIYAQSRGLSRAVIFLVLGIMTPVIEEIFFRGLIHAALRRGFSTVATLVISSGIFGLWHVYPSLIVFTFLIGCGLAWLREHERSLLGPIVAHVTINCLSLIFFGTK